MHWLAKQGLTKWILFFFAILLSFIFKIKGESSMKKDKVSIKSILINHILKFIYDVCVNFLEGALLANALYTN